MLGVRAGVLCPLDSGVVCDWADAARRVTPVLDAAGGVHDVAGTWNKESSSE